MRRFISAAALLLLAVVYLAGCAGGLDAGSMSFPGILIRAAVTFAVLVPLLAKLDKDEEA